MIKTKGVGWCGKHKVVLGYTCPKCGVDGGEEKEEKTDDRK